MTIGSSSSVMRRDRLRRATAAAHARLDDLVDAAGFFVDRAGYGAYLHATLEAREPLEAALDLAHAAHLYADWPKRKIAAHLRDDLGDLGCQPPASDHSPVTHEALRGGDLLGILYVLEGSALGAHVLRPRAAAIGMSPHFGARHLALQTSRSHSWANFLQILEQTPLSADEEEDCIAAAVATFARFATHYDKARSAP
jgi:heme oxygenase (biliverdin-IX-beta and delta-forming)